MNRAVFCSVSNEWVTHIVESAADRLEQGKFTAPLNALEFACSVAELYTDTHPDDLEDWYLAHEGTEFLLRSQEFMEDSVGELAISKLSKHEQLQALQFFAIVRIASKLVDNLTSLKS